MKPSHGVPTRPVSVALLLAAIAVTASCTGTSSRSSPGSSDGAAIYRSQGCDRCHGATAQGGRGPALAPIHGDETGWLRDLRAAHARDYPSSTLSDADALALYAWLAQRR